MVYAHMRYSDMPFMGSVTTRERALDSIEMARILFGSDYVDNHCVISGNINMNSPLVYDGAMSGALRAYSEANQCPVVVPFVLSGATGPVTLAAAIAQSLAEVMVGVALGQVVRPGSPAVFGNFITTVNLRAGAPTFGTAESVAASYVVGQIARRFNVPLRCSGGFTSSPCVDAHSTNESVNSLNAAILCGSHFVLHAAGWMESALTVSYEKLIIDADYLGSLHGSSKASLSNRISSRPTHLRKSDQAVTFLALHIHSATTKTRFMSPSSLPRQRTNNGRRTAHSILLKEPMQSGNRCWPTTRCRTWTQVPMKSFRRSSTDERVRCLISGIDWGVHDRR